jgi:hypothetical protein
VIKEIRLPSAHPRFRPRLAEGMRRPGHPGTAIRSGEDLYEIVSAEHSGGEWVYRLEPWTGQDTIRVCVEWDELAERKFLASLSQERLRRRKGLLAWSAQALLGFLPTERQERLYQTLGLDPARATLWSAVLEILVAAPFVLPFLLNLLSAGTAGVGRSIPAWAGLLACLVAAEGAFRLMTALFAGEPLGSLFLLPLDLRMRSAGPGPDAGDELLESGDILSVVSPVPKAWWERAGGVTYRGQPYVLEDSASKKRSYSYRFRKGGAGFPALDPDLEKVRNRSSDLSYVFAPLWGFLPARLQRSLEFFGRYKPRPYAALSIGFDLLLALALAGPGLKTLSQGSLAPWPLVKLAAAVALFTECVLRFLRLVWDGRTTGSILGFLVRPLFRHAVKGLPSPGYQARS